MFRMLTASALAVAFLGLSGCASNTNRAADFVRALGDAYAHCERTVTYNFAAGALNPASGATVAGSINCEPRAAPAAATAPPPSPMAAAGE